jgi:hypothetical protein
MGPLGIDIHTEEQYSNLTKKLSKKRCGEKHDGNAKRVGFLREEGKGGISRESNAGEAGTGKRAKKLGDRDPTLWETGRFRASSSTLGENVILYEWVKQVSKGKIYIFSFFN